jgi:hypothetical protein
LVIVTGSKSQIAVAIETLKALNQKMALARAQQAGPSFDEAEGKPGSTPAPKPRSP